MKSRWNVALKECVGNDLKGLVGAIDEVTDWVDGPQGKPCNPAQIGGGAVRKNLLMDMKDVNLRDINPRRNEHTNWVLSQVLRQDIFKKFPQHHLKAEAQKAWIPETRHPFVYKSRQAALDQSDTIKNHLQSKSEDALNEATIVRGGDTSVELKAKSHPLQNGTPVTDEDDLSLQMEKERRDDAHLRMKTEIYTNRIAKRQINRQFAGSYIEPPKSLYQFYYDGDDLRYSHTQPLHFQNMDRQRGIIKNLAPDLDSIRQRNLQNYVRKFSEFGSPETVGDVQKMLSEQRSLLSDMHNQQYVAGSKAIMTSRRNSYLSQSGKKLRDVLKDAIESEKPLIQRVVTAKRNSRRRGSLLGDEAHQEALLDIASAESSLKFSRSKVKNDAFGDHRMGKLMQPGQSPVSYLPEHRRATFWLNQYSMPGDIEDPRENSPFKMVRDPSQLLTSELKGYEVGCWEANDGAGFPNYHRVIAEKIKSPFDYQRAADRVMSGLQEKSMCDWRPDTPATISAYLQSSGRKGLFNRRPISFFDKENPDLRLNAVWDDALGAPIMEGRNNEINRLSFYEQRLRWEKRKEIAIALGLDPKQNETQAERDIRRGQLDDAVVSAVNDQTNNGKLLSAMWEEKTQNMNIYYGSRIINANFQDKRMNFPLSERPMRDIISTLIFTPDDARQLSTEHASEKSFTKDWFSRDSQIYSLRRHDPRVGYLQTAGKKRNNSTTYDKAGSYFQIQDALWELRVYQGEPEPGPLDKTWVEDTSRVNMMNPASWKETYENLSKELDDKLIQKWKTHHRESESIVNQHTDRLDKSEANWGVMSPKEIDFWKLQDGSVEGLEMPREMSFPIQSVNNIHTFRNLAKTPWDRLAAADLVSKVMNPEDDQRYADVPQSYYFHRNRVHYHRLGVQRLRAFGPELRELKELSERIIPQSMVHKMKNHHAVARHNIIPQWSDHVTRNGSKFVQTPKVSFDNIGLLDDVDDYIRVNPHLTKWENM
eukprot:TRINITY_DN7930_c3_g1_i1.p1 TRINITY_DN7930_c3_g1~~TRINITY_DN7930_c3_g1_i1.p1  ORF type:complete len:988 (+),score=203.38 TRINITY_DN7930_c3_g1_i1:86-3049(+)